MRRTARGLAVVAAATLMGQLVAVETAYGHGTASHGTAGAAAGAAAADDCRLPAPDGVGHEHEGPTNYQRWLPPSGTRRAVFLFVDFPDAVATADELAQRRAMFDAAPARWLTASSYGRVSLQTDFTTTWHRMPRSHTAYAGYNTSFDGHKRYIEDAVRAADAAVNFAPYHLVYVVSPVSATTIFNSPAFIASPGTGIFADNVELRHGANFGRDMDAWGYRVLLHETGHVFGLPDLYAYGSTTETHAAVGGWDLMGLVNGPASDYFAWHKWKMGWLDNARISCVTARGQVTATLAPLSAASGLAAVVVRTGTNRAVVVENRQASAVDEPSDCFRPGVLAYVVDSSVGGGSHPVRPARVLDRAPNTAVAGCTSDDPNDPDDLDYGGTPDVGRLADATLTAVGHQVVDAATGVTIRLTGAAGTSRTVRVTW